MSDRRIDKVILHDFTVQKFKEATYLIFVTHSGLTVADNQEFRGKLRDAEASLLVLKNSFIKLGLASLDIEVDESSDIFKGDTGVIVCTGEPVNVSKVVKEYAKGSEIVTVKGGVLEGRLMTVADVEAMADMPSKEALLGSLLGVMKAPAGKLVRTLSGRGKSLVYVLENFANKLENES
ncbi:MAG: 50S ribosomal protein L10 [Lentisphaeria bacterium]|nr:50S ribosomal protein L10 [Lentisphaeria bacterium]